MLGELTVGHLYVGGGDAPEAKRVPGGLLGADFSIENGRYRFARVYNGENWNPSLRAPLTQPGVNVQAGEYLLAVNGRDVSAAENVYSTFEDTAGKSVVLKVGPSADGTGSREVTVVPVASEANLRYLAWIEGQPAEGGRDERRQAGVRVPARHGERRLHQLQPLLLRPDRQGRGGHRRAVQRRRLRGGLHRGRAQETRLELLRPGAREWT